MLLITVDRVVKRTAVLKLHKRTVVNICKEKYTLQQHKVDDTMAGLSVPVVHGKNRFCQRTKLDRYVN